MTEQVLLVCTSTPANIRRAIERFPKHHVFLKYELDLLCLGRELKEFQGWPNVRSVLTFPGRREYRSAFRLWWKIVRQRYSVVVVLWCLDPSRSLANAFALLTMGRRLLVFNENLDCAFLRPSFLLCFLRARVRSGAFGRNFLARTLLAPLKHGPRGFLRLVFWPVRLLVLLILVVGLFVGRDRRRSSDRPKNDAPTREARRSQILQWVQKHPWGRTEPMGTPVQEPTREEFNKRG